MTIEELTQLEKDMTIEELTQLEKEIKESEDAISEQWRKLSDEQHQLHVRLREAYQTYIDEHFPFKVGDKLKYKFINGEWDSVTRNIEITEILPYYPRQGEITVWYKCNGRDSLFLIADLYGNIKNSNGYASLEKLT